MSRHSIGEPRVTAPDTILTSNRIGVKCFSILVRRKQPRISPQSANVVASPPRILHHEGEELRSDGSQFTKTSVGIAPSRFQRLRQLLQD